MKTVFLLVTFFLSISAHSQIITYCTDLKEEQAFMPQTYAIGQQDENIMIWHYDIRNHNLKLSICDKGMVLSKKTSIHTAQVERFAQLTFFRQNDHNLVLLHYMENNKKVLQLYSYQPETGNIVSLKVIEALPFNTQTTIKYSPGGQYTGLIQAYNTTFDSTLIRYSVYDESYNPVRDISFILPHKYDSFDFSTALIDKTGNLVFYTNLINEKSSEQAITLYRVNIEKDSLLVSDFFKSGACINIQLQQDKNNENIIVSGILLSGSEKANDRSDAYSNTRFFIMQVNKDLDLQGQMLLVSIDKLVGTLPYADIRINSVSLVLNKDSGYNVYVSGLSNYAVKYFEGNTGRQYMPPEKVMVYRNYTMNKGLQIAPNVYFYNDGDDYGNLFSPFRRDSGSPAMPSYMRFLTATASGTNFFSVLSVNSSGAITISTLQDKESGNSTPEYEYITNTSERIHYIFSRGLKRDKQSVSDIAFQSNQLMTMHPLLINPAYALYIIHAQQVSPHSLIVPFSKMSGLSFARIDLE